MAAAAEALDTLGIPYETRVVSAHRTPDLLFEYAASAEGRGIEVIVAGAGGAAHLPGMAASKTLLPVLGVPIESKALKGMDSLLSIVQMPGGVPVGTLAIEVAVARQRAVAAVHQERVAAEVLGLPPTEEVQEHRLVVPEQEHAVVLAGERDQPVDHGLRVRAAVHVVAQEHEAVARGVGQRAEQPVEQLDLAVDVAHRVEHSAPRPAHRRRAARP